MTPSLWSRDPYLFKRPETIFNDAIKNGKMMSRINFFCQGVLLAKFSSLYHVYIPKYIIVLIFTYKPWSVNSDHPKNIFN